MSNPLGAIVRHLLVGWLPLGLFCACGSASSISNVELESPGIEDALEASDDVDGGTSTSESDKTISSDGGMDGRESAAADAVDQDIPIWEPAAIHVMEGPLCSIPEDYVDQGGDPVFVPCAVEADRFSDREPSWAPSRLKLVTWNVEYGADSALIADSLLQEPNLADADFILLNEVPRRNLKSNPANINQARELAQALRMDYVFAVEWDYRLDAKRQGEDGVALLSKYPLGNVVQIRHIPASNWYRTNRRFGGRITLAADAWVGGRLLRLYSSHLCMRGLPDGRALQGAEIRDDANALFPSQPRIVAGDFNTWTCNPLLADCTKPPRAEPVVKDFLSDNWMDGTEGYTEYTEKGYGFFPMRLDWIFYQNLKATPGTIAAEAKGSDHVPLYFDFSWP